MPAFTAIALDRFIEPGATKSMVLGRNSSDSKLLRKQSTSNSVEDREMGNPIPNLERWAMNLKMEKGVRVHHSTRFERRVSVPTIGKMERGVSVLPNGKPEGEFSVPPNGNALVIPSHLKLGNGAPTATTTVVDKLHYWTQISPAFYATPESTPLPDSPFSFTPSPYIVNHKRRGPRLMKNFSEDDAATWKKEGDENGCATEKEAPMLAKDEIYIPLEVLDSATDDNILSSGSGDSEEMNLMGACIAEHGSSDIENVPAGLNGRTESIDNEATRGAGQSINSTTVMAEFYDAWEELSSEGGPQQPLPDIESELQEMKLSLLMEIEKRKQAEETLNNLRSQWQRIREQLSLVGLNLPADQTTLEEGEQPEPLGDPAAELCQEVLVTRFVSNAIGRAAAKAEVEMEMEAQISTKNFEIGRLLDRLHYFEAVNQEMSQRNQEVVETARRLRQRRNRRHKWMWGSITTAVTMGSTFLAFSYMRSEKGSPSLSQSPHEGVHHHHPN